jgi:hypothetical protein
VALRRGAHDHPILLGEVVDLSGAHPSRQPFSESYLRCVRCMRQTTPTLTPLCRDLGVHRATIATSANPKPAVPRISIAAKRANPFIHQIILYPPRVGG